MKKLISIATIMILIMCISSQSFACTIFNKEQNGRVLAGNNEDWTYSIPSKVWIAAPGNNTNGRICFAISSYVQGGMNDKGLFYDGATCPTSEVPQFEGKPSLGMDLGEVILSECENVQEVVKMVKEINIPKNYTDHLMFADSSGKSVVIEWVENELRIIPKEDSYQLVTNFWISNPKLGWYPCNRYDKAKPMLEAEKDITIDGFADILKATAQNWGDGGTKYSNIYDLNKRDVYIYNKGDFSKLIKYSLQDEIKNLKKDQKIIYDLEELFNNDEKILFAPVEKNVAEKSVEKQTDNPVPVIKNDNAASQASVSTSRSNKDNPEKSSVKNTTDKYSIIYKLVLAAILILIVVLICKKRLQSFRDI